LLPLVLLLTGCFGVSQNPSYFPHLLPTGDIIPTHAKPPGPGYYANFDPHAVRLEVVPARVTVPVQTQHILIATVYDENNQPRRNRRVEWIVQGAGHIIEVDESGWFPGRGFKVDPTYAVSYTNYFEHCLSRGTGNPNDEITLRPGQTWCIVSSATEGDTRVTVYAPGIANRQKNTVVVTTQWIDADFALPQPSSARAGTEQTFTAHIARHTDHQPLSGYRVRYRILDGPPAVLLPGHKQEAVVSSDLAGNASVTIAQVNGVAGVNKIGIEIIRSPDPSATSGVGIVIGQGETAAQWLAPSLTLSHTGPDTAVIGQEVSYTIQMTNNGQLESKTMTVFNAIPDGLKYLRSEPPAVVDGKQLVWTLGTLPAGKSHKIDVVFQATQVGSLNNCASVVTEEGLKDEKCVLTQIATPQLKVMLTGPATGTVGVPVTTNITVTNPGGGQATNVVLKADFDKELEHEPLEGVKSPNPVTLKLNVLKAGESQNIPLTLTPRQAGKFQIRVLATADGKLSDQAEHALDVQKPQIGVSVSGPKLSYVGQPVDYTIKVTNSGSVALSDVVVRHMLPQELTFQSADQGGKLGTGEVVWNLGALQPGEQRVLQMTARCEKLAGAAASIVAVTGEPGVRAEQQTTLEILGVPALSFRFVNSPPPVEVGKMTFYQLEVTNTGSLPATQVEIKAILPPEMKAVSAKGPTKETIAGQNVTFAPLDSLAANKSVQYTIEVQALKVADVRFRVELHSQTLRQPVVKEQATTIYPGPTSQATPAVLPSAAEVRTPPIRPTIQPAATPAAKTQP
jgi:uncharacterized repeat protein (TIGR01451 family)